MTRRKQYTLRDIVDRFGGELIGDPDIRIGQVATLEMAGSSDIVFVSQPRYLAQLNNTRAAAVILGTEARDATAIARIACGNPYAYYAKVATLLNPAADVTPGVHRSAVVDRSARIQTTACVRAGAVIGKRAKIGKRAQIGAGCFIGDGATVGDDTTLHANVAVYHECRLGARCIVHAGVVIGADGFGIAQEDGVWKKIPQIGRVIIGNDVEIGANTTIDRGTLGDTEIADGVKLDNQIQIAHNVRIGAHTAIAACVGIAGSATIGRNCALGGAAMIYGHITIADNVNISAGTLVMKSLDKAGTYTGVYPFSTHQRWLKNAAQLRQLGELAERVKELEKALGRGKRTKS